MACLVKKDKSLLDKASDKLTTAKSTLNTIISSTTEPKALVDSEITTNLVTNHFKDLHELLKSENQTPSGLNHSLSLLNELYVYLNSLTHASGDELVLEQRKQIAQVVEKVQIEGKRSPFPLNSMMQNVAEVSQNLVSGGVKKHYNVMWQSTVPPFCKKAIQGLYPIAKSSREITYEDFTYWCGMLKNALPAACVLPSALTRRSIQPLLTVRCLTLQNATLEYTRSRPRASPGIGLA